MSEQSIEIGRRIRMRRDALELTQSDLGSAIGVNKSTIMRYESGQVERIKVPLLQEIARKLDVSPEWLALKTDRMGCYDCMPSQPNWEDSLPPPNVTDDVVTFPVIGEVAAGFEHIAEEEWTGDKIDVPKAVLHGRAKTDFFVLSVVGDSMYPLYLPGDKVLVRKQSTLNRSGDVGVIRYDGDKASLKKIEYSDGNDRLKMVPINPLYPPQEIAGSDLEKCAIIGIPVLLIRELE